MSAADSSPFIDSNVLLYAWDPGSREKQRIARSILLGAIDGAGVISSQVLAEFASALLHKTKPPAAPEHIRAALDALRPVRTVLLDAAVVARAVEAHAAYGIRFYDGMIVAAAERAGCGTILSEDLNSGQKYFGIAAVNPFR
jgi:predicted nucleic acid-binding protein